MREKNSKIPGGYLVPIMGTLMVIALQIDNIKSVRQKQDSRQRIVKTQQYIDGTVLNESGTVVDKKGVIEKSEGADFGNDSVRIESTYAIQFRADHLDRDYVFQIRPYGKAQRLGALEMAIEKGTRIRIKKDAFYQGLKGNVGIIWDKELEVIGKPQTYRR